MSFAVADLGDCVGDECGDAVCGQFGGVGFGERADDFFVAKNLGQDIGGNLGSQLVAILSEIAAR